MNDYARMIADYRGQYGDETENLFEAMMSPAEKIALVNPFLSAPSKAAVLQGATSLDTHPQFARMPPDGAPFLIDGLMSHYFLDLSSIYAPLSLPIAPTSRVLDMCAAPGGKLLVMLSRLIPGVHVIGNDISSARAERLRRVIHDYVPPDVTEHHVRITNKDALNFGLKGPGSFDAVLLDAPCSSEAHVVRDSHLLKQFVGIRKTLPMRQFALLAAALLAVKPGGFVMYATCTINRLENEGVVAKALGRKKVPCEIVDIPVERGDKNEFGISILPHRHGAGPAFLSLLRRL